MSDPSHTALAAAQSAAASASSAATSAAHAANVIAEPADNAVASLVSTPGSGTATALSATIAAEVAPIQGELDALPSGYVQQVAPESLAGPVATSGAAFDPAKSLYGVRSWSFRRTRARLACVAENTADLEVLLIGDSNTMGLGPWLDGTTPNGHAWADHWKAILTARGYTTSEGAFWPAAADSKDTRWATAGTAGIVNGLLASFDNGGNGTFTTSKPCTGFEITYLNAFAGTFTYSVDGAAAVTVTRSGAGGYSRAIVSGLASSTHNIKVTAPVGGGLHLAYIEPTVSTKAVRIHKAGVAGSKAQEWATSGTFDMLPNAMSKYPTLTCIMLGTNDYDAGRTTTQLAADLTAVVTAGRDRGSEVMLIAPPPRATGDLAAYYARLYTLANDLQAPLLDLRDLMGTYSEAKSYGLMSNASGDTLHLSAPGQRAVAAAVDRAIFL